MSLQECAVDYYAIAALFLCGFVGYLAAHWLEKRMTLRTCQGKKLPQFSKEDSTCDPVQTSTLGAQPAARNRKRRQQNPKAQVSVPLASYAEKSFAMEDTSKGIEEVLVPPVTSKGLHTSHMCELRSTGTSGAGSDNEQHVVAESSPSITVSVDKVMAKKARHKTLKLEGMESGPDSDPSQEQKTFNNKGAEAEEHVASVAASRAEPVTNDVSHEKHGGMSNGTNDKPCAESVPTRQLSEVIDGGAPLTEAGRKSRDRELSMEEPDPCTIEINTTDCNNDLNVHEDENMRIRGSDNAQAHEDEKKVHYAMEEKIRHEEEELEELGKFLDELASDDEDDLNEKPPDNSSESTEAEQSGAPHWARCSQGWESHGGGSKDWCKSHWRSELIESRKQQDDWMRPFDELLGVHALSPQTGGGFVLGMLPPVERNFDRMAAFIGQHYELELGFPFKPIAMQEHHQQQLYMDGGLMYKLICIDVTGTPMSTAVSVARAEDYFPQGEPVLPFFLDLALGAHSEVGPAPNWDPYDPERIAEGIEQRVLEELVALME